MWDLLVLASNAIQSVVMIKWVWVTIGVVVWAITMWVSMYQEPQDCRTEAAMIGSLAGAVLGFVFPAILVFLPFILPPSLLVAAVALAGAAIANFTRTNK